MQARGGPWCPGVEQALDVGCPGQGVTLWPQVQDGRARVCGRSGYLKVKASPSSASGGVGRSGLSLPCGSAPPLFEPFRSAF